MQGDKRILLLGGTGVLGRYLTPELRKDGWEVYITSRSAHTSNDRGVIWLLGDAKDDAFLDELSAERFDAIVDFMIYTTDAFSARCEKLLSSAGHYLFLSSYRVYADCGREPITENSPRLLDTVDDPDYLKTDEYALTKSRQEDLLRASGRENYTILRPAITYGGDRFQLGTMEANEFLVRALRNKPVIFPEEMLDRWATMTWSGDVGKMIARLVCRQSAFGEAYTVSTSEHKSWNAVLSYYRKILGMQVRTVPLEVYRKAIGRPWQIKYDRMFDRVIGNSKILRATGIKRSELMPLEEGLRIELNRFVRNPKFGRVDEAMQKRIDQAVRGLL